MKTRTATLPSLHRRPPGPGRRHAASPLLPCLLLCLCGAAAAATVRYVDVKSSHPTAPYTTWATAARVIQDAVGAAAAGDEILVTNGVYATGGRNAGNSRLTNRVVLAGGVLLRSVNGPEVTMIQGAKAPGGGDGEGAVRCVHLADGARLVGFTLTNGAVRTAGDVVSERSGGGVWCATTNGIVVNCVLTGNSAYFGGGAYRGTLTQCVVIGNVATWGGGAYESLLHSSTLTGNSAERGGGVRDATLYNCALDGNQALQAGGAFRGSLYGCTLTANKATGQAGGAFGSLLYGCSVSGNSARDGGGVAFGQLRNCTLTGNWAESGGGASQATQLYNCIVYFNDAAEGANYTSPIWTQFEHCCTTPVAPGLGNIASDPQLASTTHLAPTSPCRRAGSHAHARGVDIDGEPWADPPAMGADEPGATRGPLSVEIVAEAVGFTTSEAAGFRADISGLSRQSIWDFGDGTVLTNQPFVRHAWSTAGVYEVKLTGYNETHPDGITDTVTVTVSGGVAYANAASGNPVFPYSSWETAATSLQGAVDAASVCGAGLVLVTNGVYATGGRMAEPANRASLSWMTRVVLPARLTLRSINGPEVTIIQGAHAPGGGIGEGSIRCVYMADLAMLDGFTLAHGAADLGGGVCGASTNAVLTNCVLTGNSASSGGGAWGGSLTSCRLEQNWAGRAGGGAYSARLQNSTLSRNVASSGGGAAFGALRNCTVTDNAAQLGGGTYAATVQNCALRGNSAAGSGGGAYRGTLRNCLLVGNTSQSEGGGFYASEFETALYNCTLTGNRAAQAGGGAFGGTFYNCIVYFNQAPRGANYSSTEAIPVRFEYSCTTPLPSGPGNLAADPRLATGSHLLPDSPCRRAGRPAYASGVDIDGEAWATPPAIGADQAGSVAGPLAITILGESAVIATGYAASFTAMNTGPILASVWDFGDGAVLTNQPVARHAWNTPGVHEVRLTGFNDSYPEGVSTTVTVTVSEPVSYVDAASANAVFPYVSWETAARTIQEAVDGAGVPDWTVLVTNGVYATGERKVGADLLANRVVLPARVTLRSVHGPDVTIIQGAPAAGGGDGDGAVRCVYLEERAHLSGFTLTNGATLDATTDDRARNANGGGAWCASRTAVLNNCVLAGNSAASQAGGIYQGTLFNCRLTGNSAPRGGGALDSQLYNCALTGNAHTGADGCTLYNCTVTANAGGGVSGGALYNCIVYFNDPFEWTGAAFRSSCTSPLPPGPGNLAVDPQLASLTHLSPASPCNGAGSRAYARTTDLDGEPWGDPPAMGADQPGPATGPLSVGIASDLTHVAPGWPVVFEATITGVAQRSEWDFGDGTAVTNQPVASHVWHAPGLYPVRLTAYNSTHPEGVTAMVTVTVSEPVTYVDAASANPLFPYSSWATAARTIQEAVDAATVPGGLVLVTNGVYATGGRAVDGTLTNRVAVTTPLRLLSVNGPEFTFISGETAPGDGNGNGASPCVYLASGASLSGFTLSHGAQGVWCASTKAVLTNCVLTANAGTGATGGTLYHCTLSANAGDGAAECTLDYCTLAGNAGRGARSSTLYHCTLTGNAGDGVADSRLDNCTLTGNAGDGAQSSTLYNCALTGNAGDGAESSTLHNCTLTGNVAGGVRSCSLQNCIVYFNGGFNWVDSGFEYSCTTPLPSGPGNLAADPQLVSLTRLAPTSPCLGAGNPAYASGVDLDGEPWTDPPAMGADQPGPTTSALAVGIAPDFTHVTPGWPVVFEATMTGVAQRSEWDFGEGAGVTNQPVVSHVWNAPGLYPVRLTAYNTTHPEGVTAMVAVTVSEPVTYVDVASRNPLFPYSSWATAARTIQEAVDAATVPGGLVLVTNGVYATGGRAVDGTMTNRVAVTLPLSLRSVNGPALTIIEGAGERSESPWNGPGPGAIRCVYLADGASLSGFTLTKGTALDGGGAWCASIGAVLTNCVLADNSARSSCGWMFCSGGNGGGAYGGTLHNCVLTSNSASDGGGSFGGTLYNCLLMGNAASNGGGTAGSTLYNCTLTGNSGGGVSAGALYNCIVYFNDGFDWADAACEHTCTTPLPPGPGNLDADPQLASLTHLSFASPCIGAGHAANARGVDIDGEPWANPPAMGVDQPGTSGGPLDVAIVASEAHLLPDQTASFSAWNTGPILASVWDFGDGTVLTNQPLARHAWSEPGLHVVRLTGYNETHPQGVTQTITVTVQARVSYVDAASANPVFPYLTWATAARTIQDAVDAAGAPGWLILVTNGVYATGERRVGTNLLANRVVVPASLTLQSVNGPHATTILGAKAAGGGGGAVRCVHLEAGARLSGFTLTNGSTLAWTTGDSERERNGGGAWCASTSAVLTNCVLGGNLAVFGSGGGVYRGTLESCRLVRNSALSGGGGASDSMLDNCVVTGNSTQGSGGGIRGGSLRSCTLTGNVADQGGGVYGGALYNCIVWSNQARRDTNYAGQTTFSHSCTDPLPPGLGNTAGTPVFVTAAGDLRLAEGSPCINAGSNAHVSGDNDFDGRPRIVAGNVDMGAYEYQGPGMNEFIAWLQRSNLPTDGSADTTDSDSDGLNNWQEWRCHTVPTDPLSVLRLLSVSLDETGVTLSWPGVAGVRYFLERSTDLRGTSAFTPLVRELPGTGGTNAFTDTNAVVLPGAFYRVGVKE